ncbi:MAG TPA: efflux RND transporter periplasmic adaptor subunit [Sedimenticola thiotaurini]|uniref:Efflux RND transporter periplasmic adaptor subunit n=1 Tax=Sedimenticola thiotaurini TaxID=1543721 RepID=A0A831RMS0_9GAMM|nr:efflux RND transporter periplasmic adaptor subunit [Sedimenticola thiotaurini]
MMRLASTLMLICLWLPLAAMAAPEEQAAGSRVTVVTTTRAGLRDLEVWETSVGQLQARTAPTVAAEVGGRIVVIHADVGDRVQRDQPLLGLDRTDFLLEQQAAEADIQRLQALVRAQKLKVGRLRRLVQQNSTSQSALDDAEAQLGALDAQLLSSRVRLQQARRKLEKTGILSPVAGRVDRRFVSVGDYVKAGTPLFHITSLKRLRVKLPYPESLVGRLRVGLPARLDSPVAPDLTVTGRITEIRPVITVANRSIEVIIDVDNPGPWDPGASVTGRVRVERRDGAVVVPEISVIKRPAGDVVYLIDGDRVRQQVVRTGLRLDGMVEITHGLTAGQELAVDGAGFLTDGARVRVARP